MHERPGGLILGLLVGVSVFFTGFVTRSFLVTVMVILWFLTLGALLDFLVSRPLMIIRVTRSEQNKEHESPPVKELRSRR